MDSRIVTVLIVVGVVVALWVVGKIVTGRLPEQFGALVGQLVPVLIIGVVVIGVLVIIDPNQADRLLQSLIGSVPKVMVAVIVVIIARALGRIVGMFAETALRRVSSALASRARITLSSLVLAIGVIIAMQQVGIPTNIILVLVASASFGVALAVALSVGIGSVPLARQIAAGRHVQNRYSPGERVTIGEIEGKVVDIGLSTTRIDVGESRYVDVPNADFIGGAVSVEQ